MSEPFIFLCPEITRQHVLYLIQWLKDNDVRKYLSDSPNVAAQMEQLLNRVNHPVMTQFFCSSGKFYMVFNRKKVSIGFIRLIKKGSLTEMVIVIGDKANWGKGFGTSAIREALKIAFFENRSEKVIAKIHKDNLRSMRAFVRVGFEKEQTVGNTHVFTLSMNRYIKSIREGVMVQKKIYITELDRERLLKLIDRELHNGAVLDENIQSLEREIRKAIVVPSRQISDDIITMNSKAIIQIDDEETVEVSLVYPNEADMKNRKLSVLSPVGTAILGYSAGDRISWRVPSGIIDIHIREILYQPEAAGHFHL